jgi:uncharacterized protein (TIGR03790 family)
MDCASRFNSKTALAENPRFPLRRTAVCGVRCVLLMGLVVLAPGRAFCVPSPEARATVVIYNSSDANSQALAKYYATRREVPDDHVIGLACPPTQEISRAEYNAAIAGPLRKAFVGKGWWQMDGPTVMMSKIRFVALIRGVPLKIRSEGEAVMPQTSQPDSIGRRDEASVDSELACLGLGSVPTSGLIPNSYFRRFTAVLDVNSDPGLLLVCRLDAPSDFTVRAMIDDAISTERDGLWGWGYVDSRSIKSVGYVEGDEWMTGVAASMRKQGIPVLWDKVPETLPTGYPATDAAVYYGWYADRVNGPFADPSFRFRPGAVAVHIHSFSAATLSDPNSGWAGPLLARGAAVTMGNVYEPYLSLTAHLDVFQDRLMAGFTFAESAYMSLRALSWMTVAVGDPLYRPYANWETLRDVGPNSSIWEKYRGIILDAGGSILTAAPNLTRAARETGSSMFLESLAAAQADASGMSQSLQTVNTALAMNNKPLVRFRLVLEKFGLLNATGKTVEAGKFLLAEQGSAPGPAQKQLWDSIIRRIFPPSPTPNAPPAKK